MVAYHGWDLQGPEEEGEVGPGKMNRCICEGCQSVRQREPLQPSLLPGWGWRRRQQAPSRPLMMLPDLELSFSAHETRSHALSSQRIPSRL